ncbi:MAG: hypothetical protein J6Z01_10995 [Bacteroidales bacterium]|nr:hypothetical protein [Bacteroidales bacterium]
MADRYKVKVTKDININGQVVKKGMEVEVQSTGNPLYNSDTRKKIAERFATLHDVDVDKIGSFYGSTLQVEKQ